MRANIVEQEEETINQEGVRQKEYLERVVASQKHQLKQMEKLHKLTNSKMIKDNKVLLNEIAILAIDYSQRPERSLVPNPYQLD